MDTHSDSGGWEEFEALMMHYRDGRATDDDIKNFIRTERATAKQEGVRETEGKFMAIVKEWIDKGFELQTLKDRIGVMKFDDLLSKLK